MRFLGRWAFRCLILFLVLVVALVLLKDVLLKSFLESLIRTQTGLGVKMARLEAGLLSPTLTIDNLKLYNRPEFGGSPFLDIPDLHVEYDWWALVKRKLHLRFVRLAIAEINIVEARDGQSNFVLSLDPGNSPLAPSLGANSILGMEYAGIDSLNLTLGKVKYTNLKKPGQDTEVTIGLKNEIATNLRTISDLNNWITKILFRNGITISTESAAAPTNPTTPRRAPAEGSPRRPLR
jgi:uncharacterized protein involved in outer membrane biogenesis